MIKVFNFKAYKLLWLIAYKKNWNNLKFIIEQYYFGYKISQINYLAYVSIIKVLEFNK